MKRITSLEPWIFYTSLLLLLIPVWSVEFFVTSDGPCHLFNARILSDWDDAVKNAFYKPFYFLNPNFDPNRLYYIITVPLLGFIGPQLAEKIFLTIYILGFGLGFRFLISEINPASKFISTVGLLFCYHKLLMMGFFNNSLSFAMWFIVAAWWWKKRNENDMTGFIVQSILFLVLFSSHPLGLIFCLVMIGCMIIGLFYYEWFHQGLKSGRQLLITRLKGLFISLLPSMVLFAEYLNRSDMSGERAAHSIRDAFRFILEMNVLVTMDEREAAWALAVSIFSLLIFTAAVAIRIIRRGLVSSDGLLLFIGVVIFFVIAPPHGITGGLDISFRIAIVPMIALLCWAATATFPVWAQVVVQVIALGINVGFLTARFPVHKDASHYAAEIYQAYPHIRDTSTVLVLNYDWEGSKPNGEDIANRIGLFTHVDCYLGAGNKAMVISDNYESHFSYFPVQARWNTDMYGQTDKDGINFDHRPPRADILSYKRRTEQQIDYVLMLGYTEEYAEHEYTREIFAQLDEAFQKVFTSDLGRVVLYERRVYN